MKKNNIGINIVLAILIIVCIIQGVTISSLERQVEDLNIGVNRIDASLTKVKSDVDKLGDAE